MAPLHHKSKRILFYSSWILLSLIQSYFTQIQDDEAYYWVYSRFLSWGYFDHPPMIALLIKGGTFLLPGILGVRLLPVILNVLTLFVTEKLIEKEDPDLFYVLCLSVGVLQVAGFWAVPDTPLLFFTSIFFFCYKKFIDRPSLLSSFLLALSAACLLYSKYHGVLVIFFTIISNYRILFRQKWSYVAVALALALLWPHLLWQYHHRWITFTFQLFQNKIHPYQISFTIDYILGQLLVAGPLSGIIIIVTSLLYHPRHPLERALRFTAIGIFIFFMVGSVKGEVEPNWTVSALVPLLVLSHNYLLTHTVWKRWLFRLAVPTTVLAIIFRLAMVIDFIPVPAIVERFHSWKKWPSELKERTNGLPVVFGSSYQRASMYWYATGQTTYSLNSYIERSNNYNLWPIEDSLLGRKICFMDIYHLDRFPDTLAARLWTVGFKIVDTFYSFSKVNLAAQQRRYETKDGQPILTRVKASIPYNYQQFLLANPNINESVRIGVFNINGFIKDIPCPFSLRDLLIQPEQNVLISSDLPAGNYFMEFAINSSVGVYTHNSERIMLTVR